MITFSYVSFHHSHPVLTSPRVCISFISGLKEKNRELFTPGLKQGGPCYARSRPARSRDQSSESIHNDHIF